MRVTIVLPALLIAGCPDRSSSTESDRPRHEVPEAPDSPDNPHALPLGHPAVMPHDTAPQAPSGTDSDLHWQAPEGWQSIPPASSMRRAEWTLPHVPADSEDASLVVYYFGNGQGGGVQDNLDRWYGQFEQPDGRPSRDVAHVAHRTVSGLNVTIADLTGTFSGGGMPGMPATGPKPGFRLLAAIVETRGGPWFFKITGPAATVDHWRASFDTFVGSLHE
jgi:hypothetical protein